MFSKSIASTIVVIMVLCALFVCAVASVGAQAVTAEPGNQEPVILVPGWIETPLWMRPLEQKLRDRGHDVYPHRNVLRGLVGIELSAKKLSLKVEFIKAITCSEKVDLVGHSEGGLIARYYIQRLDGHESVDDYVSLGTPHQGSYIAYLAPWSKAARQQVPGSDFLNDLNTPDCTPGDVEYTSIYTRHDGFVVPWEHGEYPDSTVNNRITTWFVMHFGLLRDVNTANWVDEALD